MSTDRNKDIVSRGGGGFRWPWDGGKDVNIGSGSRIENSTVNLGASARVQNSTVNLGSTARVGNSTVDAEPSGRTRRADRRREQAEQPDGDAGVVGWKSFIVTAVVMAALVFHALPHVGRFGGLSPVEMRAFLAMVGAYIPLIGDFDAARWLVPAVAGWMWQPLAAGIGAGILRLVALNAAKRNPLSAIWIAAAALAIDAATWLLVGLTLWGAAFSAAEGEAVIALLKVEAAALVVLLFLLRRSGRSQPGRNDAVQNGED